MRAGALAAIGAIVVLVAVGGCDSGGQSAGDLPTNTVTATVGATTSASETEPSPAAPPSSASATPATASIDPGSSAASASVTAPTSETSAPTTAPATTAAESTAPTTEHSKAGAVAAANAYIRAVDHAYATGDVGPLKKLTAPECRCHNIVEVIPKAKSEGYHWNGDRITIINPRLSAVPVTSNAYSIRLLVAITALSTTDANGQPVDDPATVLGNEPPHPRVNAHITTQWNGTAWVVSTLIMTDAS